MTLHAALFYLLAAMTGASAVGVVVSQNIVRAATWLLFALAGTAGVFFLLGADFIGATQLLVYVGGTLVLVVFGVMLTARGPFVHMTISGAEWAIGLGVGLLLYGILAFVLIQEAPPPDSTADARTTAARQREGRALPSSKYLGAALLGAANVSAPAQMTGPEGVRGRDRARLSYLLPFEIVSVHLLVVLVGAAYLARAKRRRGAVS